MGVDRTDYLFYGIDVGYDNVNWDDHEALIDGRHDAPFVIIYDGMSGNYAMAGKVIVKSDPYDGIEFYEITPELLPDPDKLKEDIEKVFGQQEKPLKLFLFSHFH